MTSRVSLPCFSSTCQASPGPTRHALTSTSGTLKFNKLTPQRSQEVQACSPDSRKVKGKVFGDWGLGTKHEAVVPNQGPSKALWETRSPQRLFLLWVGNLQEGLQFGGQFGFSVW